MSERVTIAEGALTAVAKVDEERRLVLGWANVNTVGGRLVVDRQGDVIPDRELEDAVLDFSLNRRVGSVMHKGHQVPRGILFSMTPMVQKALGVDLGKGGALGLWVVDDDETWASIKAGRLPSLSLGGRAVREEMKRGR